MISVHTEITDDRAAGFSVQTQARPFRGWILFDGDCSFCRRCVAAAIPILAPRGFIFLPLQTPWIDAFFYLPAHELLSEMRLLLPTMESLGGADAILELAKRVWWSWPLVVFAHVPGVRPLLRAAYRGVAARRSCSAGACEIPRPGYAGQFEQGGSRNE